MVPTGWISSVRLGTTVATNALLEHQQAPVLLLTMPASPINCALVISTAVTCLRSIHPPGLFWPRRCWRSAGEWMPAVRRSNRCSWMRRYVSDLPDPISQGIDVAVVALLHAPSESQP